jgi:UDP-N-acetylmuramoyl-tripeptide--D-alanyl-D-alanine ligase
MNLLFVLASSFFFLWIIREIFFWLKIWQDSEYRLDRLFEYFRRKKQRFSSSFLLLFGFKLVLFISFAYTLVDNDFLQSYQYIIVVLYVVQVFIVLREIYANLLKKPILTVKATILLFSTLVTVFFIFSLPLLDKFFWLLLIDLSFPFIVAFFVFLLSFPTELYADIQIEKATRKLRENKNLIVIGVTGSYGKSITKEFIAYVLARQFRVVKTHGNYNTAPGIARVINEEVSMDTQIFVAEMSAYKRGEIKMLCEFIRPKFGVLTAINNHHLSLFKTFENIKKTNFELLTSVGKHGMCLVNGDNKYSLELSQKMIKRKILYKCAQKGNVKNNENQITAFNILHKRNQTTFDVQLKDTVIHLVLHTHHGIEYLLPGIYFAFHLGISEREIKKAVATFK